MVDHGELIDLNKVDPEENGTVSRKEVVEIIEARLEEIFDLVNRELKNIDRDGKLPAGVVLTGGGSELQGVLEVAKDALRLPAQMGQTQNIVSIIDRVEEPTFAVSCGLVLWAGRFGGGMSGGSGFGGKVKQFTQHKAIEKLKKTFKSFLP
jgi:cell division protein FtsA